MSPLTRSDRIGFVGLGNIGLPMARVLLADGWQVQVLDLNDDVVRECADAGAQVAGSPEDLGACAAMCLAVSDDEAVSHVLEDGKLLEQLAEQSVVLVHSTVLPATAVRLAEIAGRRAVHVLDAPVSGGAARAAAGDLTIMIGGAAEGLERARPVLDAMASSVLHVGQAGAGAAVKLANQLVMFASLAGALEGLELAAAHGVSEDVALEVFGTSTGDTWVTRNWGFFESLARTYDEASVPVRYRPWSKDLWDVVHAARVDDLRVPVAGLLAQLLPDLVEQRAATSGSDASPAS